ncbi:hypothetical protein ACE3KU_03500 [Enterobacter hormaechei subsp. steigerwaltii]
MSWQGIPYPSFISNTIDAGLTVTKIPEVLVNTGFGWDTVAGSVVAAFIGAALPTALAFHTLRRNDNLAAAERANQLADLAEARETQIQLARMTFNAQVLSSNRQQWINNLRENVSCYISLLGVELSLRTLYDVQKKSPNQASGSHFDTLQQSIENKRKISELATKIELMLNPNELTTKALLQCIREVDKIIRNEEPLMFFKEESEASKQFARKIKSLKRVTQRCLKNEWKRVKEGK